VHLALINKEELLEHGFVWHAERIDNWIHRLQPKRADSQDGEGERAPSSENPHSFSHEKLLLLAPPRERRGQALGLADDQEGS
jgi:hypothetical protein